MATISNFVTSAIQKLRNGDVANNRPNSEALQSKIGGNINYLIDKSFYDEEFVVNGFFNANSFDNGVGGISRIMFDSEIISYQFGIRFNGASGNNIINAEIRDEDGLLIGNLFGAGGDRLLIVGNNKTNILLGRDVENAAIFSNNIGVGSHQYGVLNFTTLLSGWMLIPFIEANGPEAINAKLKLRLRGV